jgi:ribose 5-phosphate isomerase B
MNKSKDLKNVRLTDQKVVIGSDHAGFTLKEQLKKYLMDKGTNVVDLGTDDNSSTDYPIFGKKVATFVVNNSHVKGIIICGTGIGISMAANLIPKIKCVVAYDLFLLEKQIKEWDINVLSLGSRSTTFEKAITFVDCFLQVTYENKNQKLLDHL